MLFFHERGMKHMKILDLPLEERRAYFRQKNAEWRERNRELHNERNREYRRKYKDAINARNRERCRRKKEASML